MDSDIKLNTEIYHFDIPLRSTLWVGREKIARRQGYVIALTTKDDISGYGEVTPLPGLHTETAYDAGKQLQDIAVRFQDLNQIFDEMNSGSVLPQENLYKSVRFGLESAIIDLLAQLQETTPAKILDSKTSCTKAKVNGLITRDQDLLQQLEYHIKMGYDTVKIKMGKKPIATDFETLNQIHDAIGDKLKVRIDANRSWSIYQAEEFYKNIDTDILDYIEEPLQDASRLPELFEMTGMPIAVDESFHSDEHPIESLDWCKAIVFKPALLGSIFRTYQLMKITSEQNMIPVISDTFHTSLGITMLTNLSALANSEKIAMGLDTIRWLGDDLLYNQIKIDNGFIDIKLANDQRHNIDFSKLDKIS